MTEATGAREESLMGHLLELRSRLLKGVLAVIVVFVALLPFANQIYARLTAPLSAVLPAGTQLVAIEVASPFFIPIKVAFFVAVMLSMPALIYQAWAFVAPGLYEKEKRLARPLLVAAIALFYVGCVFAYYLVLPTVFAFLAASPPDNVLWTPDISEVLSFLLVIFLAFGLSFEMPVAVMVLVLLKVVTPAQLREARGYVIVGVFVLAAIITPPDVVSQIMLAVPMWLLYELGILAGVMLARAPKAA
ncbi:MAG: twin-arginine translocase subunit TatC [Arenimonas sp.]|nr:twin-arginine translocase subunit TatC [Arenimonas sp.]